MSERPVRAPTAKKHIHPAPAAKNAPEHPPAYVFGCYSLVAVGAFFVFFCCCCWVCVCVLCVSVCLCFCYWCGSGRSLLAVAVGGGKCDFCCWCGRVCFLVPQQQHKQYTAHHITPAAATATKNITPEAAPKNKHRQQQHKCTNSKQKSLSPSSHVSDIKETLKLKS